MHVDPTVGWFKVLFAIFLLGMFVRLMSSRRLVAIFMLVILGGVLLYQLRASGLPDRSYAPALTVRKTATLIRVADVEAPTPPRAENPSRPKRAPKPKPAVKAAPPVPMQIDNAEAPPQPPVATVAEAAALEPPDSEPRITLYHGWSTTGHAIDSLPEWVTALANAAPGSDLVSFSSDRFATIEEAEKQLYAKARDLILSDLRTRTRWAVRWAPSFDFFKSSGFILERCVERTSIEVGKYVEPMYRVHWKALLSKSVRESVDNAWRPVMQESRLEATAVSFLGATALLAFVNVILRLAPWPKAKKAPPAV